MPELRRVQVVSAVHAVVPLFAVAGALRVPSVCVRSTRVTGHSVLIHRRRAKLSRQVSHDHLFLQETTLRQRGEDSGPGAHHRIQSLVARFNDVRIMLSTLYWSGVVEVDQDRVRLARAVQPRECVSGGRCCGCGRTLSQVGQVAPRRGRSLCS